MSIHYVPARRPPTPDIMADVLSAKTAPELIDVLRIKTNGGTQMRAGLNAETVSEYMQTLKDSDQAWPFPPVVVFFDGTDYWLADGFHRVAAMRQLERIDEIPADVRVGDRRAAVLYAAGANAVHGLRRTNQDKRRAVETLLRDEEWQKWSNREIARQCNVAESSVRNVRDELERSAQIAQMGERTVSRGGQTYTQNTERIGASRPAPEVAPAYATVAQLEEIVRETAARWYRDETPAYAVSDMRAAASVRGGGFWLNCIGKTDPPQWREVDLAMAIRFVADEMARPPAATPGAVFAPNGASRQADDESATLAARRMNKLHTLKVRFGETIDLLDEFGDLTGRHTASLLAKRELTNLLEILDSEMNALEKGMQGV